MKVILKKKTNADFVKQVFEIVGNEYTFLDSYKGARAKIRVKHNTCGNIYQVTPDNFLRGKRCPKERLKQRDTMNKKIKQFLSKNGLKLVKPFESTKKSLLVHCNKCNMDFKRSWVALKNYPDCPFCSNKKVSWDTHTFAMYVDRVTNGEYKLVSEFKKANLNVKIKHITCNSIYDVMPLNFLKGDRCPNERYLRVSQTQRMGQETFKKKVSILTGDEYSVIGNYRTARLKILMKHNKCGRTWEITPDSFLRGHRCPHCIESQGEHNIFLFLSKKHIDFISQYKFKDCKYKFLLPFDFYIPSKNMCIEYDGIQHFEPVKHFGGEKRFKVRKIRDRIKNKYCKTHGIKLLRIKYDENLTDILNKTFK